MEYLYRHHYEAINFKQFIALCNSHEENIEKKRCIITFDDGYKDVIKKAYPLMNGYGFTGVVFLSVGDIEKQKDAMLSWDDVRFLLDHGWEIGSHTMHHVNLEDTPDGLSRDELCRSKALI